MVMLVVACCRLMTALGLVILVEPLGSVVQVLEVAPVASVSMPVEVMLRSVVLGPVHTGSPSHGCVEQWFSSRVCSDHMSRNLQEMVSFGR